jgi:hypothetical protein
MPLPAESLAKSRDSPADFPHDMSIFFINLAPRGCSSHNQGQSGKSGAGRSSVGLTGSTGNH